MSWGLPANIACSLVNTIIDTSGIWALTPLATSIIKYTNNSPVRHLPQQNGLFQLGASRNLRSPMGSRSNSGGLPFAQGITLCLSIHLPMAELLSSGQVVQNVSGRDTSTIPPSSNSTSTEPQFLWK